MIFCRDQFFRNLRVRSSSGGPSIRTWMVPDIPPFIDVTGNWS